jgi:putative membrane protein
VNPPDALALLRSLCTAEGRVGLWTFDLWITAPSALSALLYIGGTARLWRHAGIGRGIGLWQAGCYAAGWLVLAAALVSPIHRWGGELFTIHMIEHELVMAAAAPLVVLARPGAAFAWALPMVLRRHLGLALRQSGLRLVWRIANRPLVATVAHGAAIWAWHAPPLFEAALANVLLHRLQHISFFVTGVLFWWALVRRRNHGIAAAHLFATMLHTSILGALIALAPRVLYRLQTGGAEAWGLTPLQDQQLAGLLMWIPAGTVYAGAALFCIAQWVRRSDAAGFTSRPLPANGGYGAAAG